MVTLNISNARDKLYQLAASRIKYSDVINISTKDGNVIMISEEDYNSLIESLYLAGIKNVYEDIEEAVNTPTSDLNKGDPWK
ncbi:MAG: type II toxin-antitoxin system Phd/YefM family antitoxin [Bacilli bacterium]|nr:type II toxin-antitoxin system Phd/YefM family antitoxin [Bacilli bacterium]